MPIAARTARSWLERWDRQQEFYLPDRAERFRIIADVVAIATGRPDPVVLDIGCGPGSLSARVHDRLPRARLIGVDSDPLLLGLAAANHPWLELVDQDLRAPQWTQALPCRTVDAVVSTTALHWLSLDEMSRLYATIADLLRPGGVFVNGDHMPGERDHRVLATVSEQLLTLQADRAGVTDREDWSAWWKAATGAPELAELVAERAARPIGHDSDGNVGFAEQVTLLRAWGFAEVEPVWQLGADRILVGVR